MPARAAVHSGVRAAGSARGRSAGEGEHRAADVQLAEIQRSRLLAAAIPTVAELGYSGATVAHITDRARVSRRTFYELFANREECIVAVLDHAADRVAEAVNAANLDGGSWRERVRGGLWAILRLLDREPVLAQVCVVQAARGGPLVLARRDQLLARLVAIVDEGRREGARGRERSDLTAEGLVGAALSIVHARLARAAREPLSGLLGELMSMIALPYLGSAAARRESERPLPAAAPGGATAGVSAGGLPGPSDPLVDVPMRLTYRTVRVLQSVADHPGASNRQTAQHAGITDAGQVSKLLARLQANGLLVNSGARVKGEPNAWGLTPRGQHVARSIRVHTPIASEAA